MSTNERREFARKRLKALYFPTPLRGALLILAVVALIGFPIAGALGATFPARNIPVSAALLVLLFLLLFNSREFKRNQ